MTTFLGRHPALPPSNNMLQLPGSNQQKGKKSVIRSLSKSKIFEFQQSNNQAQHAPPEIEISVPLTEQEHNLPQSPIRDTLLADDKITMKDIWEGNAFVMAIVGSLQDTLARLPNEPYGIRVNFPTMAEFNGIQIKKYPVTTKDTVQTILQQIITRFHMDMSEVSLTTLNGIQLDSSATLVSLGVGTLLHTWDLVLVYKRSSLQLHPMPSLAYVPQVVFAEDDTNTKPSNPVAVDHAGPPENLNSKTILEQSGLKVLVGLLFPAGSVEFGSRLRGMQKLELFVPIKKMFADLCRQRFEITDASGFTLATMEGITLHPECVLADYGLGIRFSTWDLRVMRKSEALSPPFLNHRHLMWLFIPEAWTSSKRQTEFIEASVSIDSKWQSTQTALIVAQKEITFLNDLSERDRKTIADLNAQVDDYVEEVTSLNASKALYIEMSGILDVDAFAQEKCTWKKEKERLQAYFDSIIGQLEARLAEVEDENDKLKRKGIVQELMAELVQMRAKYKEAMENNERELQRVMRDNLVQRRKLVADVEERVLEISYIYTI